MLAPLWQTKSCVARDFHVATMVPITMKIEALTEQKAVVQAKIDAKAAAAAEEE